MSIEITWNQYKGSVKEFFQHTAKIWIFIIFLNCFLLEFFRWDIKSIEQLPEYMKICFLALYNTTNEMGYEILKDQGLNIIPYLHKVVLHASLIPFSLLSNSVSFTEKKNLNWVLVSGLSKAHSLKGTMDPNQEPELESTNRTHNQVFTVGVLLEF